jgi:hypothetical protein
MRIFFINHIKNYFMQTARFNSSRLKGEEKFTFLTDFEKLVNKYGAEQLGVMGLYTLLKPKISEADRLLEKIRSSSFTLPLQESKALGVRLFTSFYGTVKLAKKQKNADKKAIADHLFNGIKVYRKDIATGGHAAQVGGYHNLFEELAGPLKNDMTALNLTSWETDMKEADAAHTGWLQKRDEEQSALPLGDLKKVYAKAFTYYKHILDSVDNSLIVDGLGGDEVDNGYDGNSGNGGGGDGSGGGGNIGGGDFERAASSNLTYNFVVEWNIRVKYYSTLSAQRATRNAKKSGKAKGKKDEESQTGPDINEPGEGGQDGNKIPPVA